MRSTVLIVHNVRSCHNVGALLRTADGLGVQWVFLTGYTPYPSSRGDGRLPHLAAKIDAQIHKTALGAERTVHWDQSTAIEPVFDKLRGQGFTIVALEQHARALSMPDYKPHERIALLVGREVEGIEPELLTACDHIVEIPMRGKKESFNVAAAAAMALYHLTFAPF